MRQLATRLIGAWLLTASPLAGTAASGDEPAASREQLERQLQEQLAANEALRARIDRLEKLLAGDVCADPVAAENALKEGRGGTATDE